MAKTIANPVSPSKVMGRVSEWFRRMEEAGLTLDDLQTPIDDPTMRERLVRFWKAGGYEATTDQKLARAIMDRNFLGIEEVSQHLGVTFTEKQFAKLASIPFTEATLQQYKDTHILVAGYPLSILDVRSRVARNIFYSLENAWYNSQAFARKKVPLGWYLLRKDIVPGSTNRTYQDQLTLLGSNEKNPLACQVFYAVALYFLATGERLFRNVYARCQDTSSDDYRVLVGYFDEDGLVVLSGWVSGRVGGIGLAAARKSPSTSLRAG